MRIVPEWKDYDYEIKLLWDQIYNTNTREQIEYKKPETTSIPGESKVLSGPIALG